MKGPFNCYAAKTCIDNDVMKDVRDPGELLMKRCG